MYPASLNRQQLWTFLVEGGVLGEVIVLDNVNIVLEALNQAWTSFDKSSKSSGFAIKPRQYQECLQYVISHGYIEYKHATGL